MKWLSHLTKAGLDFCNFPKRLIIPLLYRILTPVDKTLLKGRVRTGPGKPGKCWNFILAFSRTGKSLKKGTGPVKFWKSVKLN